MNKLVASKFNDDIVNLAIYYFSFLPVIETRPYGGQPCRKYLGRFYGLVLLIVSALTIFMQIKMIDDVLNEIIAGDQVHLGI